MSAQLKTSIKYPGSLVRPRFEPGLLLLDEDLTAIVDHTRALSRLLFRSLFGCGVICGFKVTPQIACGNLSVTVAPGVALDCRGDPIEMCEPQVLGMPCAEKMPPSMWVLIRRSPRDHNCASRDVVCPSDDGGSPCKPTRSKDCFELTLTKDQPQHACGCADVPIDTGGPQVTTAPIAPSGTVPSGMMSAGMALSGTGTSGNVTSGGSAAEHPTAAAPETVTPAGTGGAVAEQDPFRCHHAHYCGVCACGCCDCCGDGWVVLARIDKPVQGPAQTNASALPRVEYSVRRFIRPYLAPDPMVEGPFNSLCKEWKQI